MAMSVSTQPPLYTRVHPLCWGKSTEVEPSYSQVYTNFPSRLRSFSRSWYHCALWGGAPDSFRNGSLQVIGLSAFGLDFLRELRVGWRGSLKGDPPPEPSLSRTHLSARDTTSLPGPALSVALESGVSKEVHSSPGSEWSHNTQPTGVYDPSPLLEDYIVAIAKSTECRVNFGECRGSVLFLFSACNQQSLISTAVKSEAILRLRLARRGRIFEDQLTTESKDLTLRLRDDVSTRLTVCKGCLLLACGSPGPGLMDKGICQLCIHL